jgi:hypothetical protein
LEFCSRDATTVRITYTYGGGNRELVITSAYLPYDSDEPPPSKEVKDITDYCYSRKKQLIIGCDANAHHTLWGSISVNPRGESLMEYLVSSNLNILNHGNEPTFVVSNRKEVIDLILGTNKIANLVSNLHLSDEKSLSDHRYICFQIGNISINQVTYRNPRRTNWESYKDDLKVNLETLPRKMRTIKDTDGSVDQLKWAIISSYYRNCPANTIRPPGMTPWWNKKLSGLRAKTRKLFNIAKRTGQWDTYKETLTCYNKEIRKAKRSSWRGCCREINDVPGSARLMRVTAKQATNRVSTVKLPNGQLTETGKGTLEELFRVHFPDSKPIDDSRDNRQGQQNLGKCECTTDRADWNLAKRVINQSRIRWALGTLKPFKAAGTDEIVPALLQQGEERIAPHLCRIYRACLAYGFIPIAWRQVKVTFIPKPGKLDYTEAKAYRPISLS